MKDKKFFVTVDFFGQKTVHVNVNMIFSENESHKTNKENTNFPISILPQWNQFLLLNRSNCFCIVKEPVAEEMSFSHMTKFPLDNIVIFLK